MHAEDRLAGADKAMQRLQHEPVAAERHDDVGLFRLDGAVRAGAVRERRCAASASEAMNATRGVRPAVEGAAVTRR